jgi:hypothetical protein
MPSLARTMRLIRDRPKTHAGPDAVLETTASCGLVAPFDKIEKAGSDQDRVDRVNAAINTLAGSKGRSDRRTANTLSNATNN